MQHQPTAAAMLWDWLITTISSIELYSEHMLSHYYGHYNNITIISGQTFPHCYVHFPSDERYHIREINPLHYKQSRANSVTTSLGREGGDIDNWIVYILTVLISKPQLIFQIKIPPTSFLQVCVPANYHNHNI